MFLRPNWVEISRSALAGNYGYLRALAGGEVELLAVVKADAYGHGAALCAPALAAQGARWLGVTSVEEGAAVRALCPQPEILVMAGLWPGQGPAVLASRLTPVAWEDWQLDELEAAALSSGLAPGSVPVHLEIDTGMARQGVNVLHGHEELERLLARFPPRSPLRLGGVMTHFSAPEDFTSGENERQVGRLEQAVELMAALGHRPDWLHAGNSATLLSGRGIGPLLAMAARLGARPMVRPGLALYGFLPRYSPPMRPRAGEAAALSPVLSWKTQVTGVRALLPGDAAGYNGTFTAERPTRLALLAAGYADGLSRSLSNRFDVLILGQRARIAGRISMDQAMVDVTDIAGVRAGDEAVLIGSQGMESISAYDHADATGSIVWEVTCDIGGRARRVAV